jgi:hypothetical protein
MALLTVLLAGSAQAITVAPLTFEQLTAEASAVVYARVSEVRGQWTDDRRAIESIVALEPLRYFKGYLGDRMVTRLPGGEAGGMINVLPGAPVLREGDLVVLFLTVRGPAIPVPVGFSQGIFRVHVDGRTGRVLVSPPPLKSSAAGRIIRGAADRRLLTLDAFAAAVAAAGDPR